MMNSDCTPLSEGSVIKPKLEENQKFRKKSKLMNFFISVLFFLIAGK